MKPPLRNRIIVVSFIIAAIAAIVIYLVWNTPHTDVLRARAINTDAVSLYESFVTDSVKAKSSYSNKVLNVSGIVKDVSINQQNQQVILLKTSDPDASVNCTVEGDHIKADPGDRLTLKGICIGYIGGDSSFGLPGDVFVVRCYHTLNEL